MKREYLGEYLSELEYPEESKSYFLSLYQRLSSREESGAYLEELLSLYEGSDSGWDFKEIIRRIGELSQIAEENEFSLNELVMLLMGKKLLSIYEERGLDRDMWRGMMMDLRYKDEECHLVYGIWGNFVVYWCMESFDPKLCRVALGRLQFELVPFKRTMVAKGITLRPETTVINVHIPRDGRPLSRTLTDEAFRLAHNYFKDKVENVVFVCDSWLLWPENRTILPEKSNIRAFMDYFDIVEERTSRGDMEDAWRLFDTMERNLERLPCDTPLRRSYLEHMKKHGTTGSGFGVYVY